MTVKRYDPDYDDGYPPFMSEDPEGDYVHHSDYEADTSALLARIAELEDRVQELEKELADMMVDYIYPRS